MNKSIKTLAAIGLAMGTVQAGNTKLDSVQTTLNEILAKEGISFGGQFRGQYISSNITPDSRVVTTADGVAIDQLAGGTDEVNTYESVEATWLDLDIMARPNSWVSARAQLRMYQNWSIFFSDLATPVHTRWISIDAKAKDIFTANLGDFMVKKSPLTVWAPEAAFPNEPLIFAQESEEARRDAFVGDNNRHLQGFNLNFDAEVEGILDEVHLGYFISRLRGVQPESKPSNAIEASPFEKWGQSANLDIEKMGIGAGFSYVNVFDRLTSFRGPRPEDEDGNVYGWYDLPANTLVNGTIVDPEKYSVTAVRVGLDLSKTLQHKNLITDIDFELAMSKEDLVDNTNETIDGQAMNVLAKLGWQDGVKYKAFGGISYFNNDEKFYNGLAQTGTYFGKQILGTEAGVTNTEDGAEYDPTLYMNNFDATHHNVYKFAPAKETNHWAKAPFTKNSYYNTVLTKGEMEALGTGHNVLPGVNFSMPNGLATPDRKGFKINVDAYAMDEMVWVQGIFGSFENVLKDKIDIDPNTGLPLPYSDDFKFDVMGANVKANVLGLAGYEKALNVTVHWDQATYKNTLTGGKTEETDYKTSIISAGFDWNFFQRFSALVGWQAHKVEVTAVVGPNPSKKFTETTLGYGLSYEVTNGVYTAVKYYNVDVDRSLGFAGNVFDNKFSQDFINASIRVLF